MKKTITTFFFITALAISVTGCKDKAKEAETTVAETPEVVDETLNPVSYTANTSASSIAWKGFKPTGSHNGTINIKSGTFNVANGNIVGGSFIIDMTSITVSDIPAEDEGNGKLLGHLKSPDFFDVENHSNASFTITSLEETAGKTMLSGNLSLKGNENNVTFPVSVSHDNNAMTLTSEAFTIDRTKWNVKYGSKSFFDNLGDKFINDDMEIKITVKATKS
ncbi:YceI family protein [uncultured Algibacter sp.]|uniref:YceI family protein n=1 Tax=uncultured Algibacter sp. TaxID=298659 RepID=UPI003216CBA0